MGLFDGLTKEKHCAVCGKEVGLFGKAKLKDGNYVCDDCSAKFSPFMSGWKAYPIEKINDHLAYREANEMALQEFAATDTFGAATKVVVDSRKGWFIVTSRDPWREGNPDIIGFNQVANCTYSVSETKTEIYKVNEPGHRESFEPKRYDTDYDIFVTIEVDSPWYSTIRFKTNPSRIKVKGSKEWDAAEAEAQRIQDLMMGVRNLSRQAEIEAQLSALRVEKAAEPEPADEVAAEPDAGAWACSCGQQGNTGNFCQNCGSPKPGPSEWTCECGAANSGNFCQNCGKPRPEAASWQCECGSVNTSKFCGNCGKPRP
ncbi:DUF4428 domain-containing protein [Slackia heliotrinireducens]|uniref:DUF4428 domain-containing protein n=1 Tax=Slackia heliotrinireducens TaxID=84110 RepID=UPI0033154B08